MSRIYNQDTPDLSDLIYQRSENKVYRYHCTSQKCLNGAHDTKRIIKFDMVRLRFDSDCPDCGSVMYCKKMKLDVPNE